MKTGDLKRKTAKELNDLLLDLKKKLNQAYFDLSVGKLKQTHILKQTRQEIAKTLTVLKGIK